MKKKISAFNIFRWILLTVMGVLFAFPFYWMFTTSVKPQDEIFTFPPQLIPTSIQFNSYVEAWAMQDFTLYMLNTFKIMLFNIVLCVSFRLCGLRLFPFSIQREKPPVFHCAGDHDHTQ